MHEVATDPQNSRRAYLSYYSGGTRAIDVVCTNEADPSTWELLEVGGYLDTQGNDFWGVEAFVRHGTTYVLGSDRDTGLWIFRRREIVGHRPGITGLALIRFGNRESSG